jgi:hypothetical protein
MLYLRDDAYIKMLKTERLLKIAKEKNASISDVRQAEKLLGKARYYYDIYDYLDASRFATASLNWVNYSLSR